MATTIEEEDIEMEERIPYNPLFATIPIRALNCSCRRKLALALNPKMSLPSSRGYSRDWQGLVEAIGYPYEMNKMLTNREDPTISLLDIWEKHASNPTLANLLECLQKIERFDIVTDIMPLLERDTQQYLKNEEDRRLQEQPIQVPIVTSEKSTAAAPLITVGDVLRNEMLDSLSCMDDNLVDDEYYKYDAYVSYVDSDIEFVQKLIEKLEGEHRLELFVKDRDMLAGFDEAAADVRIIHERCKRILLIISPEFLSDPKCEFTTMFAQALAVDNNLYARKVIPVICKACELPVRLRYIARVDYTKRDIFGKFWDRLYFSIKNPIFGELPSTTTGSTSSRLSPINLMSESGNISQQEESSASTSGSTESLTSFFKSSKPSPHAATTDGVVPKEYGSEMDLHSSSNAYLNPPKAEKKKKSPTPKRKIFSFSRIRNNAQTQ